MEDLLAGIASDPASERYCPHDPTAKQAEFLALTTLEGLFGGQAGGGKSDALLMAALEYVHVPGYAALILRRTFRDLNQPGAIMSRAKEWLAGTSAVWNDNDKRFTFPSGATLTFGYLEKADDHLQYQGPEFQFVGYDEVTQFAENQYTYLISRLRRLKGSTVPLRIRAATNPGGPGHDWVKARFVEAYLRPENASPESPDRPFVPSTRFDNPHLDLDTYEKSLEALSEEDKAWLMRGDWDARADALLFKSEWFLGTPLYIAAAPIGLRNLTRYWDLAATAEEAPKPGRPKKDPDFTSGTLGGLNENGRFVVVDVAYMKGGPDEVEGFLRATAFADRQRYGFVEIVIEEEGGASGKITSHYFATKILPGFSVTPHRKRSGQDKVQMARPLSSQMAVGNVRAVQGPWNALWQAQLEGFPGLNPHDDLVDSTSGCFAFVWFGADAVKAPVQPAATPPNAAFAYTPAY